MNVAKYEINVWQLRKEREQVTVSSEKHDVFVKQGSHFFYPIKFPDFFLVFPDFFLVFTKIF